MLAGAVGTLLGSGITGLAEGCGSIAGFASDEELSRPRSALGCVGGATTRSALGAGGGALVTSSVTGVLARCCGLVEGWGAFHTLEVGSMKVPKAGTCTCGGGDEALPPYFALDASARPEK